MALTVVGALSAGCDDPPRNEYTAGCLMVLRQDHGTWMFGAKAKPVAEAFCTCFGDEMKKSTTMKTKDKARTLAFLNGFDGTKSEGDAILAVGDFLKELDDGKAELVAIVGRCQSRLTK